MILLIGNDGMLGSEVAKLLKKENIDFRGIAFPEIDVTNLENVRAQITSEIDVVFNCSGYTAVDKAEEEISACFAVNTIGPKNIAIACEEVGAKMMHISTDYVFDGFDQERYTEFDLPKPRSVYGKTKLLGEDYVREFCSKYFILRTAWLFGIEGNNFIETMLKLSDLPELKVVNDQFGTPTGAIDLAQVMLMVSKTEHYGVYHATNEGRINWFEFARYVFEKTSTNCNLKPCSTKEFPTAAQRPANSELVNGMLSANGFSPMRNWKEAVDEYLEIRKGRL
ncbi:MAG: dTDP-4-dehydrorhamnose reductase [Mycoplasmatales bacterium]